MSYSDTAVAFSTIPVSHQVRFEDRVSFLYLEYRTIVQERTGVVALYEIDGESIRERIQIPVSSLAVIMLGPGTSITQAAMISCHRSGATVMFTGGGGVPGYAVSTPLTSSARWAIAQAHLVSNERHQRAAAIKLYKHQFGMDNTEDAPIRVLRGIEGQRMKALYRSLAKKHKITGFRRNTLGTDDVNIALNIANSILYGCAAAACTVIGVNPALGVIHRGDARSLLFDLADLYKPSVTLPQAFASAGGEDVPTDIRKRIRKQIVAMHILEGMLGTLMEVLAPHLPARTDDRLIGDTYKQEVEGHRQYAESGDSVLDSQDTGNDNDSGDLEQ